MFLEQFISILPGVTLVLFLTLTLTAVIKKTWFYFYIGLSLIAFYIQIMIGVNTLLVQFFDGRPAYTVLPYQKFWALVVISIYYYSGLGLIGVAVASVRKLLKLKTRVLFLISSSLVLFGVITYVFVTNLSCNYSPTDGCEDDIRTPAIPSNY